MALQMPSQLGTFLRLAGLAAMAVLFWWSQGGGPTVRLAGSLGAGALIGWRGWAKGSLSVSGEHPHNCPPTVCAAIITVCISPQVASLIIQTFVEM